MRGQLSLPALAIALLVLTAVTALGIAVADSAIASAERSALDRQAAVDLSDRLVSTDGPLADRANVFVAASLSELNQTTLRTQYGLAADADATVTLGGNTLVSTGETDGGASIQRLVVVTKRYNRTLEPSFRAGNSITIPRRTPRVKLTIAPQENTTVSTVRVGERVALHNESGLRGTFTVETSRLETPRLSLESDRALGDGAIAVTYYPAETEKKRLGVTVDG